MSLTDKQIKRQDFVDNSIFDLIQKLSPNEVFIEWDIELISEVRDVISEYFEKTKICQSSQFYPFIKNENGN